MNSEQVDNKLLINEWQLGSQLNVAVANGTRDKFNLLLSLLSDDARDFSQFSLPKATQHSLSTLELRESLSLSAPQPLVNSGISLQQAEVLSVSLHKKDLSGIRLQSLLNNEAVLSRSNNTNFDPDIVDNLSFLSQARLKNSEKELKSKEGDAKGVSYELLQKYQDLDLEGSPVKLNYM